MTSKNIKTQDQSEHWHGTINGYTNHKCRCGACRAAFATYQSEYRAKRFKGRRKKCYIKDCTRMASRAAGNGLCQHHHERVRDGA